METISSIPPEILIEIFIYLLEKPDIIVAVCKYWNHIYSLIDKSKITCRLEKVKTINWNCPGITRPFIYNEHLYLNCDIILDNTGLDTIQLTCPYKSINHYGTIQLDNVIYHSPYIFQLNITKNNITQSYNSYYSNNEPYKTYFNWFFVTPKHQIIVYGDHKLHFLKQENDKLICIRTINFFTRDNFICVDSHNNIYFQREMRYGVYSLDNNIGSEYIYDWITCYIEERTNDTHHLKSIVLKRNNPKHAAIIRYTKDNAFNLLIYKDYVYEIAKHFNLAHVCKVIYSYKN